MKTKLKTLFTAAAAILVMAMSSSCCDNNLAPAFPTDKSELFMTDYTKSESGELLSIERSDIYLKSGIDGKSNLMAMSKGEMVNEVFAMDIYFDDFNKLRVGSEIKPSKTWFSFVFSSDSRNTADKYDGTITLAYKGANYAILRFNNVIFHLEFGDVKLDGTLRCNINERYVPGN